MGEGAEKATAEADHLAKRINEIVEEDSEALEKQGAEIVRLRNAHADACSLVARMYEAATGRIGKGPKVGLIEDVATLREDVRRKDEAIAQAVEILTSAWHVGGTPEHTAIFDAGNVLGAALAPKPETQANEELFGDTSAPNWATPPKSDSIQRGDHWQIGVAGICNVVRFDGDDITGVAHFLRIDDARMAVELQNRHAEDTSPTTSITRCQERRWGLSGNVLVNPEALHPENQNPAARPNDRCIAISFVQKHASGAVIQQDRCGRPLPCAEHGGKR